MLTQCTLALEFNYAEPGSSRGSVWLYSGDGRSLLDTDVPLSELNGWCRIVGPVDYEAASAVHVALKQFFDAAGVEVLDEGIAD